MRLQVSFLSNNKLLSFDYSRNQSDCNSKCSKQKDCDAMPLLSKKKDLDVAPERTNRSSSSYDPPPSYSEATSEKQQQQSIGTDLEPISSKNRMLHVYYESWKSRTVHITDSDKETPLYDFDCKCRRPQLTLRTPGPKNSSTSIATVNFHPWTGAIDIDIHGKTISLFRKGWKCGDMLYPSNALDSKGQLMTWKRKTRWTVFEFCLLDDNENLIANMSTPWATKKALRIELIDGAIKQEALDEVVITGLAVWWAAIQASAGAAAIAGAA